MSKPSRDPTGTLKRAAALLEDDFLDYIVIARPNKVGLPIVVSTHTDDVWACTALEICLESIRDRLFGSPLKGKSKDRPEEGE